MKTGYFQRYLKLDIFIPLDAAYSINDLINPFRNGCDQKFAKK